MMKRILGWFSVTSLHSLPFKSATDGVSIVRNNAQTRLPRPVFIRRNDDSSFANYVPDFANGDDEHFRRYEVNSFDKKFLTNFCWCVIQKQASRATR